MTETSSSGSPFLKRQRRLAEILTSNDLDFIALNPGPSLTYLTGMTFHLMERPVIAIFSRGGSVSIVLPELEAAKLDRLAYPIKGYSYGENPAEWALVFQRATRSIEMESRTVGVEPTRMRLLELRLLESAAPATSFVPAEKSLAALRMRKDKEEVEAMRKAVMIAQRALEATLPVIKPGLSEREVGAELTIQLLRAGTEIELPFAPIVSSGPNSANPHANPSDRLLEPGDLLVIDWGATYKGYISDLTRTFSIGSAEPEFIRIAQIVAEANAAGRAAAGPEVAAGSIDRAARKVISEAGYGAFFIHRTGHGIGMEAHEEPYIREDNELILQSGMTFTVEPGIYLTGRGGVRIEDNVVITPDGSECLSDLPRELRVLG